LGSEGGKSFGGAFALNSNGTQKWFYLTHFDVDADKLNAADPVATPPGADPNLDRDSRDIRY